MRSVFVVSALVFVVAAVQPASAQSSADLQTLLQRLERLERDVRTLNVQVARGVDAETARDAIADTAEEGANLPAMARLEVRISALEEDLRQATGTMEQLNFRIRELATQLETFSNDTTFRIEALEQGGRRPAGQQTAAQSAEQTQQAEQGVQGQQDAQAQPSSQGQSQGTTETTSLTRGSAPQTLGTVTPQEVAEVQGQGLAAPEGTSQDQGAPAAAQPALQAASLTPEDEYKEAFGLLRQARYDEAEVALKGFLSRNNEHRLAGNARYWLGETYYVRGQYLEAAETFLNGYQSDPNGPKAPDTLLKLGMALAGLDQKTEACQTFGKLEREFPKPAPGIAGTLAREKQRNACP